LADEVWVGVVGGGGRGGVGHRAGI